LSQNYPNPFNPSTTIEYTLPAPNHVVIQIFNTNGQLIRSLANEDKVTGSYSIVWDGKSNNGGKVSTGVYFYSVKAGDQELVKKMIVLK
jgi:flagellar hook assembly protein FlgD